MNELPTREQFLEHLNTKFRIWFYVEQPIEAELTEVSEMRVKPRSEAFSLVFTVPNSVPPYQWTYRVEHDALGEMELFLVPFEQTEESWLFEAIFNRKITVAND